LVPARACGLAAAALAAWILAMRMMRIRWRCASRLAETKKDARWSTIAPLADPVVFKLPAAAAVSEAAKAPVWKILRFSRPAALICCL